MNDVRRQPDPRPGEPLAGAPQHIQGQPGPVSPEYHEHTIFENPAAKVAQTSVDPISDLPKEMPGSADTIHRSLRTIKRVVVAILALALLAGLYFLGGRMLDDKPLTPGSSDPTPTQQASDYPTPVGDASQARSVSCLSETGPDVTTTSRKFVGVAGTECIHRTGSTAETLILSGKLTGRNTEGTGMSVTINVNGKDCNGGETLSYARVYTPLYSNCTFVVPANSAVGIKWRFLSPFGGTAAVLRTSKNIAPSISGVAIPNVPNQP